MDEKLLGFLDALGDEKLSSGAAIKKLVHELRSQNAEIDTLKQENAILKAKLDERRAIPTGNTQVFNQPVPMVCGNIQQQNITHTDNE